MNPQTWPLWIRGQAIGLLWSGLMYAVVVTGPRTVAQAVVHLVAAVLFGLVAWGLLGLRDRRLFGDLTTDERVAAVDAVRAARPPEDPRLRVVAVRVARQWARPGRRPLFQVPLFGLFMLLSVYVAIAVTPWFWFGVVFWPVVGWYSVRSELRQHDAARRFLRAAA